MKGYCREESVSEKKNARMTEGFQVEVQDVCPYCCSMALWIALGGKYYQEIREVELSDAVIKRVGKRLFRSL